MSILCRSPFVAIVMVTLTVCAWCQKESEKKEAKAIPYLRLSTPRHVLSTAQSWEGNEFPHTMSVLEMKRGGYRYWGWYGLNEGRGIGLARSNDLVNWTKYDKNPGQGQSRGQRPFVLRHHARLRHTEQPHRPGIFARWNSSE